MQPSVNESHHLSDIPSQLRDTNPPILSTPKPVTDFNPVMNNEPLHDTPTRPPPQEPKNRHSVCPAHEPDRSDPRSKDNSNPVTEYNPCTLCTTHGLTHPLQGRDSGRLQQSRLTHRHPDLDPHGGQRREHPRGGGHAPPRGSLGRCLWGRSHSVRGGGAAAAVGRLRLCPGRTDVVSERDGCLSAGRSESAVQ